MRFLTHFTFIGIAYLTLTGCASLKVEKSVTANSSAQISPRKDKIHYLLFGFVPLSGDINPSNVCDGGKWNRVTYSRSSQDVVATIFTLGIYSAQTMVTECQKLPPQTIRK